MEFVPEGGAARLYQHKANADPNSINGGGQTIAERFDKGNTVRGMLKMGEFSLHHTLHSQLSAEQQRRPPDRIRHQLCSGVRPAHR